MHSWCLGILQLASPETEEKRADFVVLAKWDWEWGSFYCFAVLSMRTEGMYLFHQNLCLCWFVWLDDYEKTWVVLQKGNLLFSRFCLPSLGEIADYLVCKKKKKPHFIMKYNVMKCLIGAIFLLLSCKPMREGYFVCETQKKNQFNIFPVKGMFLGWIFFFSI